MFFQYCEHIQRTWVLHPGNFLGTPSLAFDVFLYNSKVEIELLTCPEMYGMIESGLRGGLCFTSQKYAKADDKTKILYLDLNALYSSMLCESLPMRGFRFMSHEQIDAMDWMNVDALKDGGPGYIMEVMLEYPKELHYFTNEYPLAPESKVITQDMLSNQTMTMMEALDGKVKNNDVKLTATFGDRDCYVCHLANLQFYLSMGMKLKKIYRVITFHQEKFAEGYITKCTEARKKAAYKFEQDRQKMMGNAIPGEYLLHNRYGSSYFFFKQWSGKFMENKRGRMAMRVVKTVDKMEKYAGFPTYQSHRVLDKDLMLLFFKHQTVLLDKAIFVSFVVFELSKLKVMTEFYTVFKPLWKEKLTLLFSDTGLHC